MEKTNKKKLLIVWVHYHCGFKYHNNYIEVTENYDLRKILKKFKQDLERYDNITDYCILNIMEV